MEGYLILFLAVIYCFFEVCYGARKSDFDHIIQDYVGKDIGDIQEYRGYKGKGSIPRLKINTIVKSKKKYGYGYRKDRNPKGVDKPDLFAINTNPDFLHDPHADEKEVSATLLFSGDDFSNAKYGIPAPTKKRSKYYGKPHKPSYEPPKKQSYPPHDSGYNPHEPHYPLPPSHYPHHDDFGRDSKGDTLTGILVIPTPLDGNKYNEPSGYEVPPNKGYGPVPKSQVRQYDDLHTPPPSQGYPPHESTGYPQEQDQGYSQQHEGSSNGAYGPPPPQQGYSNPDEGFNFGFKLHYQPGNDVENGPRHEPNEASFRYPPNEQQGYGDGPPEPNFHSQSFDHAQDSGYGFSNFGGGGGQYFHPGFESDTNSYQPSNSDYGAPGVSSYSNEPLYPTAGEPSYQPADQQQSYGSKPPPTPLSGLLILLAEAKQEGNSPKGYGPPSTHHGSEGQQGYGHEDTHQRPYEKQNRYKKQRKDKIKFSDDEKVILVY